MISIDDMVVFANVVEAQSFTKAAEELGIGKARVSQVVTKLESALNVRLLNRTTRTLSLTDAGQRYYQTCRQIQALAAEANAMAMENNPEPSGLIRISIPVGGEIYLRLFSHFLAKYPQTRLDIVESDSYTHLIESRCDVAIRASSALEDSRLYATQIGAFREILCTSPGYLAQTTPIHSAQDLLQWHWVSHAIVQGDKALKLSSASGKSTVLNIKPKVSVRTTHALKSLLLNDVGFGMLPDFAVHTELEEKTLVRILADAHDVSIPLYVVYQNKALMPLQVRTLIDYLKQNDVTAC